MKYRWSDVILSHGRTDELRHILKERGLIGEKDIFKMSTSGTTRSGGPEQLPLPLKCEARDVRIFFERSVGNAISLTITDNSSSLLSVKTRDGALCVRLHRVFLDAGEDVLGEIAEFIKKRKGETPLLRKFVRDNKHALSPGKPRRLNVRTRGSCYDLREFFDTLNGEYFGGRISSLITWGATSRRYAARKRTLGSYSRSTDTIRITPILDRKTVPPYFVEFVVYHEMLHADMGVAEKNGRRCVHSKEFRQRERLYRHFEKAIAWEKRAIFR